MPDVDRVENCFKNTENLELFFLKIKKSILKQNEKSNTWVDDI